MPFPKARQLSLVEKEWLSKNKNLPVSQLTQALSQTTTGIKRALAELSGSEFSVKTKKKQVSKIGRRKDLDNCFLRSASEADTWRWLKYTQGDDIKLIEVEPTTFSFAPFGILKGSVAYTPDFKITYRDGSYIWVEVKGWLKQEGRTKIERFKKYYPEEYKKLYAVPDTLTSKTGQFFVQEKIPVLACFNELKKQYRKIIPYWESGN